MSKAKYIRNFYAPEVDAARNIVSFGVEFSDGEMFNVNASVTGHDDPDEAYLEALCDFLAEHSP